MTIGVVSHRSVSELLAFIPGMVGVMIRRVWYRHTLAKCGARLFVDWMGVLLRPGSEVGDDVFVGPFGWVGLCRIGNGTMIAGYAIVLSGMDHHGTARAIPVREQPGTMKRIEIGADCWIGARAVVGADLAEGTIVGAGAVVTQATEAYSVVVGNPARKIRDRA